MHLGLCIWGREALPTVIRLVVLEPDAPLPHSDGDGGPITVIARQRDEPVERFLRRLEKKLSNTEFTVGAAYFSLNNDVSESAKGERWRVVSRIADALQPGSGKLKLFYSESRGDRVECLSLAQLLAAEYSKLTVSYPGQSDAFEDDDDELELPSGIRHAPFFDVRSQAEPDTLDSDLYVSSVVAA